ncbi:ATP-dependent RNA helicase DbpA [Pseudolysobacter antarcticus]|uniref:ATP-dependent RNA helicase DbpA n=1 Tax=Pseudolysobacter antarcticus TaxID=2511995 RepID=A0A411HK89_9GAMM|nr:ATP-dependent RNA helicase DbpA [Pseudolysobacter antarcticus]QBB70797.1 ATP-dependent RNA helicase DbpA [Pseudolysobacter antarcticus]
MKNFTELALSAPLMQALDALSYTQMTPVQALSLPPMLAGSDVIAQARTGSGKTVAFGLGLLSHLDASRIKVQALVLCPTRELADQVAKEIRRLARFVPNIKVLTLCGGIPLGPQLASLSHDPHIVVGTPGRIQEHLRKRTLHLSSLKVLVLDEADRMLDMGFEEAINEIIAKTPKTRQTLLFSATYPDEIRSISANVQRTPVEVTIDTAPESEEIQQLFFEVEFSRKPEALAALLAEYQPESAVVFCNTRRDTQDVADHLAQQGFSVLALHGDLEQRERDEILVRFANKSCAVLVATDVAARGLDIKELAAVISYELPTDPDVHVHRIGRTGRAGQKGLALSLCSPREINRVLPIETREQKPVRWGKLDLSASKTKLPAAAAMVTLVIDGGRKDKVRAGDILGALTGDAGVAAEAVGRIDIFDVRAYVAIQRKLATKALERLGAGKIKGRNFRVRRLG